MRTLVDRFWQKVRKTDGCWLWTGGLDGSGYGQIFSHRDANGQHLILAHRLSFEIHFGAIPRGRKVCHTCDNTACVRPDHLFPGTHLENMRDMVSKGRHRALVGEEHHRAALSNEQAAAARAALGAGEPRRHVAQRIGVSLSTVDRLARNQSYLTRGQ